MSYRSFTVSLIGLAVAGTAVAQNMPASQPQTSPAATQATTVTTAPPPPTTGQDWVRARTDTLFQGIRLDSNQRRTVDSLMNQAIGVPVVGNADSLDQIAARQRMLGMVTQLDARIRAVLNAGQQQTWDRNFDKWKLRQPPQ
ncbi:MAG TPA: hypothetical protein VGI92_03280 [Gemmatimonadales bacterium]|jgi:hypothetical protein